MNKNAKTYTILIIPDRNGGKTFSLCLSKAVIILLFTFLLLFAGTAAWLLYESAVAAKKLQYFNALRSDNDKLSLEVNNLRQVNKQIVKLDSFAEYLERLSVVAHPAIKNKEKMLKNEVTTSISVTDTAKTVKTNATVPEKGGERDGVPDSNTKSPPLVMPVDGWITQQFNNDTSVGTVAHPGIDIAAAEGMIIKAPARGIVITVETDQYYGNLVIIKHDDEFTTRYGHCAKVFVSKGEKVDLGQTIALVGNTGHSTAPHLHYEVIRNGKNVDPQQIILSGK
jgi:murein DD-endopeptidase MepM/ murein hydrolase activator NlpD